METRFHSDGSPPRLSQYVTSVRWQEPCSFLLSEQPHASIRYLLFRCHLMGILVSLLGSTARFSNQRRSLPVFSHAPIFLQNREPQRVDTPSSSATRLSERDLRSAMRMLAYRRQQASAHIRYRTLLSSANQSLLVVQLPVSVSMAMIAFLRSFVCFVYMCI
jgi:hypothetical protein